MKQPAMILKKPLTLLTSAVISAAVIWIVDHSHLGAQDENSPANDPDVVYAIPPTSPDAPLINDGIAIVSYDPDADPGSDPDTEINEKNESGKTDKLPGLQPDQIVGVTLKFGVSKAGTPIQVFAPDGGALIDVGEGLIADEEGNVSFRFQVGHNPGLYQVALRDDTHEMGVQFWVIDTQQADSNPDVDLPGEGQP